MKMVTVQDIFHLSIEMDLPDLAHRVFWAISENKVKAHEDSKILNDIDYDDESITSMVRLNMLDIGKIKLFVVETTAPDIFAFYYSENILEAHALHQELFREIPNRLTKASHLLGKAFHFDETNDTEILYFHRNKVVAYPYYLGHARARGNFLYRMRSGA